MILCFRSVGIAGELLIQIDSRSIKEAVTLVMPKRAHSSAAKASAVKHNRCRNSKSKFMTSEEVAKSCLVLVAVEAVSAAKASTPAPVSSQAVPEDSAKSTAVNNEASITRAPACEMETRGFRVKPTIQPSGAMRADLPAPASRHH